MKNPKSKAESTRFKPLLCAAPVVRNLLNTEVNSWPPRPIDSSKLGGRPITSNQPENIRGRIKKNTVRAPNGCWEWQRKINNEGYGIITILQKSEFAHRAAYRVFIGEIPNDKILRHKCDNSRCCNPDHLELGTFKENTKDAIERGRLRLNGSQNPMATLSADTVLQIQGKVKEGWTNQKIATEFGISATTASRVRRGVRRAI